MKASVHGPAVFAGITVVWSVGGVPPTPPISFADRWDRKEEAICD